MKKFNSNELRILDLDTNWKRRSTDDKRLIILVGDVTEDELYLVTRICFSINSNYGERHSYILRSMPKWVQKRDTILDFVGLVPATDNVLTLPGPSKILQTPNLKRKLWLDLSGFLVRMSY